MRTKRYEIKKLTPQKNKHFSSTNHILTNIKTASGLGLHRELERKSDLFVRVGKSPIAFDGRSTSVQPNQTNRSRMSRLVNKFEEYGRLGLLKTTISIEDESRGLQYATTSGVVR